MRNGAHSILLLPPGRTKPGYRNRVLKVRKHLECMMESRMGEMLPAWIPLVEI